MKIAIGRIVAGKVILDDGESFPEGSLVIVLARDDDDAFDVSSEQENALLAGIAQADRAEVVAWEEARERLRRFG